MSEERPKDLTVALRQISSGITLSGDGYPAWFKNMDGHISGEPWKQLLNQAADELEQMQKLNGRLLKRLAGD